jgi:hypothetical protein
MATTPAERIVRVYNRSKRTFTHGEYRLAGGTFAEVPENVASNWMKMFENDVVEAGIAQRELGGLGAELAAAKTRITELEAELAKLKEKKAKKEVV